MKPPDSRLISHSLYISRYHYQSRTTKKFIELFGEYVDFIVVSNGGIIPIEYECSFPYMAYDGFAEPKNKVLYQSVMEKRLRKFFETHKYDFVLANFSPKKRNTPVAKKVLKELKGRGIIQDFAIVPDDELYRECQIEGFSSGKMFPDLHRYVLHEMEELLKKWHDTNDQQCDIVTHETEMSVHISCDTMTNEMGNIMEKNEIKEVAEKAKAEEDAIIKKVNEAIEKCFTSGRRHIIDQIELGLALLDARRILKANFYLTVCTEETGLHRRQTLRYIRMVLDKGSYKHLKNNMEEEDFNNLRPDPRLAKLTIEDVVKLKNPNMRRVENLKRLTDEEFKEVLNGNEKIYKEAMKRDEDEESDGKNDGKSDVKKEDQITTRLAQCFGDAKAQTYVKANPTTLLKKMCSLKEEVDEKDTQIDELNEIIEELKREVAGANLYIPTQKGGKESTTHAQN